MIEDLDFAGARAEGREQAGSRPSAPARRAFRRAVTAIPTGKFRDRLIQMTANAGLSVIVADPAYTSRWGVQHWLAPLREHHKEATGHHAAALVTGGAGSDTGQETRQREPHRPGGGGPASPDATPDQPGNPARTKETRHPKRPLAATRTKTSQPQRTTAATRQPKTVRGRRTARTNSCYPNTRL